MKYRSQVPLLSARDVERPEARVRLHRLPREIQLLCDKLGIWDGDTIGQVKANIEHHMAKLNVDQRQAILKSLSEALK